MSLEPQFRFDEQRHDAWTTTVRIAGELHVSTAPALRDALEPIVSRPQMRVVMDLTGLEFIDSTGLSVLLTALRQTALRGGRLVLACANPTVLRLFQITHLDQTFEIAPSAAQALLAAQAVAGGSTSGMP